MAVGERLGFYRASPTLFAFLEVSFGGVYALDPSMGHLMIKNHHAMLDRVVVITTTTARLIARATLTILRSSSGGMVLHVMMVMMILVMVTVRSVVQVAFSA